MFTLAHLSDPHLAPLPLPPPAALVGKRITGFLNWHWKRKRIHKAAILAALIADLKTQPADHIAITGDLANIALRREFSRARDWLATVGDPHRVSIVPGNHDIYVAGALDLMQTSVGPWQRGDDGKGVFPFLKQRGPLALIGVNTGVPTPWFQATGRVGAEQLNRLGQLLDRTKHDNLFRVVLIHHPPVSPRSRDKLLLDAPDLLKVIAHRGAELIIHGHDHMHALEWLDGPQRRVPAIGVPSASAVSDVTRKSAAYNLYRIDGSPGAWHCELETRGLTPGTTETTSVRRVNLF
jgi:3',5'-cyclic AMP phosphodiesterase CpdA